MCGRFTLHSPADLLASRFKIDELPLEYAPSYNIAPTQPVLTIIPANGTGKPQLMRWGLIPAWSKKGKSGFTLINARIETLTEKASFRNLVNRRRCLILADGFFEWKQEGKTKTPYYITREKGGPFAFAGLWDQWRNEENKVVTSCTLITKDADEAIRPIHNRMPVILSAAAEDLWLGPRPYNTIKQHLLAADTIPLSFYSVSTFVNSPKNNSPRCIEPAASQ
ncbi:MAG TPA: SOS response-associated peptidase [Firmicutes bacterium]|nr:SOS response-associated peptidase [Bacillota bacterium]